MPTLLHVPAPFCSRSIDGPHLGSQLFFHLPSLSAHLGDRLKWLELTKLSWGSYMPEALAAFIGLSSLHLELDEPAETEASIVDLSALTQLMSIESFSLTFNKPGMSLQVSG